MAAPAQSSTIIECKRTCTDVSLTYKDFKAFYFELEKFKGSLHGAAGGSYSHTFTLTDSGDNAKVVLTIEVERQVSYAKRAKDAPRVLPQGSLPLAENPKNLAQQAFQKSGVKRAFEDAFPEGARDNVLSELSAMVTANPRMPGWKKTRVTTMLSKKPITRPVARALDGLWACMPFTQDRLCESVSDYQARRCYFEDLRVLLSYDPPRLAAVPAFAELYRRVYKRELDVPTTDAQAAQPITATEEPANDATEHCIA